MKSTSIVQNALTDMISQNYYKESKKHIVTPIFPMEGPALEMSINPDSFLHHVL